MTSSLAELSGLEHMLDFHLQRHGVLATNLAHADTPGYRPQDLTFSGTLDQVSLAAPHPGHLGRTAGSTRAAQFEVTTQPHEGRVDENGVEIEQTMAQVTANRLRYETGVELARRRVALLRYAAADGSGS